MVDEEQVKSEEEKVERKTKKAPPRRRKTRKEKESPMIKSIRLVVETGKVSFGYNKSLKGVKEGKPKLVIVSDNIPKIHLNELNHFALDSKIHIYVFPGSSKDLASVCGKPFLVSVLSVFEEGNSNIMELVSK